MTQPAVLVTLIVTLMTMKENPHSAQAQFVAADGATFFASMGDRESTALRIARKATENHQPLALRFDPNTRLISAAYWPMPDEVVSITDDPQSPDRVAVALKMRPTLAFLAKGAPQFDELLKLMRRSQQEGSELLLAIDPATSTIEAAAFKQQ